ncbi:penicillin-binding protein [Paenibacillus sp. FSL R7-277]|uniref:serine hydrolase domain-containing protein n=1 Tax=Paenibacillus sp. FSL R7-277 TaxID=1227352 RepID=UPI0003E1C86B|nr:serine hydrolase [Paenibacillus sp. FSL R7-277]ETT59406.1 penicillin-binding protein [Paenibacillus sp. FSL R7-277]
MKPAHQINKDKLVQIISEEARRTGFSGVVQVTEREHVLAAAAFGIANIGDVRLNQAHTRFAIASGSKLFTAIAVCQLAEQGLLSFDAKILDILPKQEFPLFDPAISVHQLLTHSSGIPDYFDEEEMEDFAALWKETPMYTLRRPGDFLPLFAGLPMKFVPGGRFHYNNAGYIMLAMLVEAISGQPFTEYVEQYIFLPCGMKDSGYFELDALPAHTAQGYIDSSNGKKTSNIYSIPVVGGGDGGAFVTVADMHKLWSGLLEHKLLQAETTALLLTPHIYERKDSYYGYGVWIQAGPSEKVLKYHIMGYDPGISFHSAYYPERGMTITALCNKSNGAYMMMSAVEGYLPVG